MRDTCSPNHYKEVPDPYPNPHWRAPALLRRHGDYWLVWLMQPGNYRLAWWMWWQDQRLCIAWQDPKATLVKQWRQVEPYQLPGNGCQWQCPLKDLTSIHTLKSEISLVTVEVVSPHLLWLKEMWARTWASKNDDADDTIEGVLPIDSSYIFHRGWAPSCWCIWL